MLANFAEVGMVWDARNRVAIQTHTPKKETQRRMDFAWNKAYPLEKAEISVNMKEIPIHVESLSLYATVLCKCMLFVSMYAMYANVCRPHPVMAAGRR